MADVRLLKKNWLLDAALEGRDTVEKQLAWLHQQRAELSQEVREGDWEVNSSTFEGGNASGRRGINGEDRLRALIAAIEELSGTGDGSTSGCIIIPEFSGILN